MGKTNLQPARRRHRSRGAALLEMVVCFLVLFYLVMGGVEFGWYLYAKHIVQSAARDGARTGIIGTATHAQTVASITNTMNSAGFGSTGYTTQFEEVSAGWTGALTYTTTTDITTVDRGSGLRVTVSAPFSAFNVRPLGIIPANKQITGVTTMVKE